MQVWVTSPPIIAVKKKMVFCFERSGESCSETMENLELTANAGLGVGVGKAGRDGDGGMGGC